MSVATLTNLPQAKDEWSASRFLGTTRASTGGPDSLFPTCGLWTANDSLELSETGWSESISNLFAFAQCLEDRTILSAGAPNDAPAFRRLVIHPIGLERTTSAPSQCSLQLIWSGGSATAALLSNGFAEATAALARLIAAPARVSSVFDAAPVDPTPASPAARAITRIQSASGLTREAIAPLAGVSRRSLHHWIAGDPISQRNEERLRALAEAVEQIASAAPGNCRERMMERIPGAPRIYDLLAEGKYEAAVARATGASATSRPSVYPAAKLPTTHLIARLAALEEKSLPLNGQIDRRLTKRIKLTR